MGENINDNIKLCSSNNNDDILIRVLDAGLFEYLQTISIIELLTSSRLLHQYRGILNIIIIILIF
jgi:hypothetical protein